MTKMSDDSGSGVLFLRSENRQDQDAEASPDYNSTKVDPTVEAKTMNSSQINLKEVDQPSGFSSAATVASPVDKTEALDELQKKLGGYGRYQIILYLLMGIVYMRGCWHAFISIFQAYDPGYQCKGAAGLPLNESVPEYNSSDGVTFDSCKQYVNFSLGNQTEDCTRGWDYFFVDHADSIVSEYDLTCDRSYTIELTTTIYMVGATCGVVFLAPISERIGGKTVMLACLWLQAIVGTVMPWSGSIEVYLVLKFFIGIFNMTIALCVAVMMHETFDSTHREIPSIGVQFFWAFGIMTLALFGWLMPDWKHLQLVITLPVPILSIAYIWVLPQSLPWLVSKGKLKEASKVIRRFIRVNNLPSIPNLDNTLLSFKDNTDVKNISDGSLNNHTDENVFSDPGNNNETPSTKTYTILDIFKHPRLTIWALLLSYLFLVNSLAYFGVMFMLDGDQYLNLFYSGLVEIPAYILSMIFHKYIGRRRSICMFMLICGVSSIVIRFVPDVSADGQDLADLKLFISLVQKFGITGSYSAIYLFASEIFPTVLRNQGVGFCSFFENIGSIAAPNIAKINNSTTIPLTIFGVLTIIGSVVALFLPETHHKPLPNTIEDVEKKKSGLVE